MMTWFRGAWKGEKKRDRGRRGKEEDPEKTIPDAGILARACFKETDTESCQAREQTTSTEMKETALDKRT